MSALLPDIDATCAALGYYDGKEYRLEPGALQCLKHLIWILRRDNDVHEYRRHLGKAKVLQTDLLPILIHLNDDKNTIDIADVLLRLLVNLTNPTLLLYREELPKDDYGRRNYMELIEILQGNKEAFSLQSVWIVLGKRLQKILEIDWAERSEEQGLLIERILVLIRNVLQVPASPEAERRTDNDASIHDQVLWALHQSGIIDLVLYIIGSEDENQYHLHTLEIVCLMYREQTAESLADASLQRSAAEKEKDDQQLIMARRCEKYKNNLRPPVGRHSRFGGTYVVQNVKSISDNDLICHQTLQRAVKMDFNCEKTIQKRSHRIAKEENQFERRSAFSVRLFLREFCIEILRSAYNNIIRQVRRLLERNVSGMGHDDSYLLWTIRFFMEFNRLSDFQLNLISESLSINCFHWVLTRMQHNMEMMTVDKKRGQQWSKRLQVVVQTFRELLLSLIELQKVHNEDAQALYKMLQNNVCYVLEYRETILHTILYFNESHSTMSCLRDIIELNHIFFKMMEKFCKGNVLVQGKQRVKRRKTKTNRKNQNKGLNNREGKSKTDEENDENMENLEDIWKTITSEISIILSNDIKLPEDEHPLPFDVISEKTMDEQKDDCMIKIHNLLRQKKYEHAVILLRSGREVWPENDCFGAISAAPEDELMLLRDIFLTNLGPVQKLTDENTQLINENDNNADNIDDDNEEDVEDEDDEEDEGDNELRETDFRFDDFAKRLVNPKVVRACTMVLADWEKITSTTLKSTVTLLHRIAFGCKMPAMLYQASLFRVFQRVFNSPTDKHNEELKRLAKYIIRQFVAIAPKNPKIYAELLFYKSIREANDLENGYDQFNVNADGKKDSGWSEEQEDELRQLYTENQRNPATDQDVIDWIADNLIEKTRTRRNIIKKLKELGLIFKAPTKRSNAAAVPKHLWTRDEDEKLKELYDVHRFDADQCLKKIMHEFIEIRSKQSIIKRMIQLGIIADKSEILPKKLGRKSTKVQQNSDDDDDDDDDNKSMDSSGDDRATTPKSKPKKGKTTTKQLNNKRIIKTSLNIHLIKDKLSEISSILMSFKDIIDWLIESFNDAVEDITDSDGDDPDDGVPLVPYTDDQREALTDLNFKALLTALGLQEPIEEMEIYWRIPIHFTANDILLRSKILSGEEVIEEELDKANNNDDNETNLINILPDNETNNYLIYNRSDDDEDDEFDFGKYAKKSVVKKNTFDELRNTRNLLLSEENVLEDNNDEFDMNTEDLRKRLAVLINDSDSGNDMINDGDIRELSNIKKSIGKRPLIIDSDSDTEIVSVNDFNGDSATTTNNIKRLRSVSLVVDSDSVEVIDADTADNISFKNNEFEIINKKHINNNNKKRRLIISDDENDD